MLSTQRAREELLPEGFGVRLDPEARCGADGRTLLGGSPMRLLRLSEHAANLLAKVSAGAPAESRAARRLGWRLCDAGLAHPVPPPGGPGPGDVTCVVPVRDDPAGLATLLASLQRHAPGPAGVIIAEDGSRDPGLIADIAGRTGARLVHHDLARGPSAARNEAWRASSAPIVAFLDADLEVTAGWLAPLLAHFADPSVAAVAPRVRAPAVEGTALERFERDCSPLDMGALPSSVGPRRRVRYVPSAALLFRRDFLETLGGFDESLRFGEDVDLIWRAVAAGWTVRYEPSVVVQHRNRPTWAALGRRRHGYGTAAASLAARHPGEAAPLEIAPWSLAAWLATVLGGRRGAWAAASIIARRVWRLHESLAERDGASLGAGARHETSSVPDGHAGGAGRDGTSLSAGARVVLRSHAAGGGRAATALRRTWLPLLAAATVWTWGRRLAIAALVVEPLVSWATRRPSLGPGRWILATLWSDAAYCAGVWRGAVAARSTAALRPRLTRTAGRPADASTGATSRGSRPTPG